MPRRGKVRMEGRRKVARAVQESGGSFLSVGRPLSLSWRPTMSPWQRARREGGRPLLLFSCSTALHGGRMCRIVRFASAVTKDKLRGRGRRGGGGERERQAELVRITKTAVRSLLEERREVEGGKGVRPLPGVRPPGRPPRARLACACCVAFGGRRPLR